jgi:uncharacterized protein (TIRG00374 family)
VTAATGARATAHTGMSPAKAASIGAALVLAAVLLYFSLRGIEWRQVAQIVRGARPGLLGLTIAIATGNLFLRSFRWRILLNAEGRVSVSTAFWATAAGYFGNNFLPARAGELVRTAFVSARSRLDYPYVLATAACERIADAVTLVAITALVLLTLPTRPGWLAGAATPIAIAALAGASLIVVLPWLESFGKKIIERAPLPRALKPRLIAAAEQAVRGIRAFHDARRFFGFAGLTIVIWTVDALATVIGGTALGLSMPLAVAFLLIAALGLGSALPSTPGYVGNNQFVAVTVLTPFGFTRNQAIAYMLTGQALSYVVVGIWGAVGLLRYRQAPIEPRGAQSDR